MITTKVLDSNFMTSAIKSHFEQRLREKLQEVSKEVVNEVVEDLAKTLQLSVNNYLGSVFYEQVVKVIVEDHRK